MGSRFSVPWRQKPIEATVTSPAGVTSDTVPNLVMVNTVDPGPTAGEPVPAPEVPEILEPTPLEFAEEEKEASQMAKTQTQDASAEQPGTQSVTHYQIAQSIAMGADGDAKAINALADSIETYYPGIAQQVRSAAKSATSSADLHALADGICQGTVEAK